MGGIGLPGAWGKSSWGGPTGGEWVGSRTRPPVWGRAGGGAAARDLCTKPVKLVPWLKDIYLSWWFVAWSLESAR